MKTVVNIIFLLIGVNSFGQTMDLNQTGRSVTHIHSPTPLERYGKDFELKNFTLTSANESIINSIDLTLYENERKEDVDVEIELSSINEVLILFASNRVIKN